MLHKFSSKLKKRREEVNGVNGANGTNGITNGVTNATNGESTEKPAFKERRSSFAPFKSKKETLNHYTNHTASRGDVEDSFEQFAQQISVSVRNQMHISFLSTATESRGIFRKHYILGVAFPLENEKLTSQTSLGATCTYTIW